LLESFPFLGFFFSLFGLSLLIKEVCHDFPVSRSATQPDMWFVAVMIGMDAHGFEREFSRPEVHGNELRANQPPKVAGECLGIRTQWIRRHCVDLLHFLQRFLNKEV
jgi:hypothetical protein